MKGKEFAEEKDASENKQKWSPPRSRVQFSLVEMPPQRIFPELDGISQYQRRKQGELLKGSLKESPKISEEEVVEEIGKYRKGLVGKEKTIPEGSSIVKNDNGSTEEVVEIIQDLQKEKAEYFPYYSHLN